MTKANTRTLIDGIPALEPERTYDWDPVEQAEKLLKASGAKFEHSPIGGAYYRLSTDTIRLPAQDRFETPSADFNDLATQNPEVVSRQLDEVLQGFREQRLAATQSVELAPVV